MSKHLETKYKQAYYDDDADLAFLAGRVVGIIGYGNQGRAQALNMRDSGASVIVGSISDSSWEKARQDGFPVFSIEQVAEKADVLCLLIPDEVQKQVYEESLLPSMRPGKVLCFSHGYNICFGLIKPPPTVDVIMIAPRMIGSGVRRLFVEGKGVPSYLAVWQDASGKALDIALAVSKAMGATRAAVLTTTFEAETEIDLFMEQAVWSSVISLLTAAYDVLIEDGYNAEEVLMELYSSEEAAEVFLEMAATGIVKQLKLHSRTSQYGQLSRSHTVLPGIHETLKRVLEQVKNGDFSREWEAEKQNNFPEFDRLWRDALNHPINTTEDRLRAIMAGKK